MGRDWFKPATHDVVGADNATQRVWSADIAHTSQDQVDGWNRDTARALCIRWLLRAAVAWVLDIDATRLQD